VRSPRQGECQCAPESGNCMSGPSRIPLRLPIEGYIRHRLLLMNWKSYSHILRQGKTAATAGRRPLVGVNPGPSCCRRSLQTQCFVFQRNCIHKHLHQELAGSRLVGRCCEESKKRSCLDPSRVQAGSPLVGRCCMHIPKLHCFRLSENQFRWAD